LVAANNKLLMEINQNPVFLSYLLSTFLSIHAQLNSATLWMRAIIILIYLLLVGVLNYCLAALMVLFLIPQQPLVVMTHAPAAHIFWTSLEEILILFNLLFLLNCSYPTTFWNCRIYNLATFLTLINNHQMWPSDLKFFVSNLLIVSDWIMSGITYVSNNIVSSQSFTVNTGFWASTCCRSSTDLLLVCVSSVVLTSWRVFKLNVSSRLKTDSGEEK